MNSDLLTALKKYQSLGIKTVLGFCYLKNNGKKSFIPEEQIPDHKLNALQIVPDHKLAIVDCDKRNGTDGFENLLNICSIPDGTICDKSQSGSPRFWFRANPQLKKSKTGLPCKVDYLTGNSKVIVPGSVVEYGGTYEWIVPLTNLSDLKPMPEPLFKFFLEQQRPEPTPVLITPGNRTLSRVSLKQKAKLIEDLNMINDSRSAFRFFAWACTLRLTKNETWGLCRDIPYVKSRTFQWFEYSFANAEQRAGK